MPAASPIAYQRISPRLWIAAWFRALNADEKIVYLYLRSSPQARLAPGLFRFSALQAAFETGLPEPELAEAICSLHARRAVTWSPAECVLYVPGALEDDLPANRNQVKGYARACEPLPLCPAFAEWLLDAGRIIPAPLSDAFREHVASLYDLADLPERPATMTPWGNDAEGPTLFAPEVAAALIPPSITAPPPETPRVAQGRRSEPAPGESPGTIFDAEHGASAERLLLALAQTPRFRGLSEAIRLRREKQFRAAFLARAAKGEDDVAGLERTLGWVLAHATDENADVAPRLAEEMAENPGRFFQIRERGDRVRWASDARAKWLRRAGNRDREAGRLAAPATKDEAAERRLVAEISRLQQTYVSLAIEDAADCPRKRSPIRLNHVERATRAFGLEAVEDALRQIVSDDAALAECRAEERLLGQHLARILKP